MKAVPGSGGASDGRRRVACPTCGALALFAPENRWRPFCSERCRSVDLGAWASERFRIETGPSTDEKGDAGGPSH